MNYDEIILKLVEQMARNTQATLDLAKNFDRHCEDQNGSLHAIWQSLDGLKKTLIVALVGLVAGLIVALVK